MKTHASQHRSGAGSGGAAGPDSGHADQVSHTHLASMASDQAEASFAGSLSDRVPVAVSVSPRRMGSFFSQSLVGLDRMLGRPTTIGQALAGAGVQAKLKVGAPNDMYEQEADRVADKVMRMPEPSVQRQEVPRQDEQEPPAQAKLQDGAMVQRQEDAGGEGGESTGGEGEEEEGAAQGPVQTKAMTGAGPAIQLQEGEEGTAEGPMQTKALSSDAPAVQRQEDDEGAAEGAVQTKALSSDALAIQRQEDDEGAAEGPVQAKALTSDAQAVQRQEDDEGAAGSQCGAGGTCQRAPAAVTGRTASLSAKVASSINALQGKGAPLPTAERAFFESRFKRDFSGVRIHAGSDAGAVARAINARAFTRGHDIVFANGSYSPGHWAGRQLLAHELVHVLQQGNQTHGKSCRNHGICHSNSGREITQRAVTCSPQPLSYSQYVKYVNALRSRPLRRAAPKLLPGGSLPLPGSRRRPFIPIPSPRWPPLHTTRAPSANLLNTLGLTVIKISAASVPKVEVEPAGKRNKYAISKAVEPHISATSTYAASGSYPSGGRHLGLIDFHSSRDKNLCRNKRSFPIAFEIDPTAAKAIQAGEKEHCQDYQLAFALSYKSYVAAINKLRQYQNRTKRYFTGKKAASLTEAERVMRQLTRGGTAGEFGRVIKCLLLKSIAARDSGPRAPHYPKVVVRNPKVRFDPTLKGTYGDDCVAFVNMGRALRRGPPSATVIKGCGEPPPLSVIIARIPGIMRRHRRGP